MPYFRFVRINWQRVSYFFADKLDKIIGIDNNMRQTFFGLGALTQMINKKLINEVSNFEFYSIDIRNIDELEKLFSKY